MSTDERARALPADLLARLSLALGASDPERAVRDTLSLLDLPGGARRRVFEQALLVGQRAREREPRASACELQLSLGVLLVLCGALARSEAKATP